MKVRYEFVTGETVEVEVSEELGKIIVDLDRINYNNDHKETRRHCTLSILGDEGEWLIDEDSDPAIEKPNNLLGIDNEKWEYGLKMLTEKQRNAMIAVYQDGFSVKEYAKKIGSTTENVYVHLYRAKKKIKKVFGTV